MSSFSFPSRALGHASSFVLLLLLVASTSAHAQPRLRIGTVGDGPEASRTGADALMIREIREVLAGDFRVELPDEAQVQGEGTLESVEAALDRVLARRDLDVVVATGVMSSHVAGQRSALPVPVVGAYVIDPQAQGLPLDPKRGVSGRPRYTYVANPGLLAADLRSLQQLLGARKLAYLVTESYAAGIPSLDARVKQTAAELGLELELVPVRGSVPDVLASLPTGINAAYVGVLPRLSREELQGLIDGLSARRIPTFAQQGRDVIEMGALAGISDGVDLPRRARRVALDVQRIALGEPAADIPVFITRTRRLVINMRTAREIAFWPDWKALTDAELIERERTDVARKLTLESAAREALERNLDFLANEKSVEASRREIQRTRARLFPQAGAALRGAWIDQDRTSAFQNQAERQINLALDAQQVIYDDRAYANLTIQKYIQESVEYDRETLRLDVLQAATQAYLDVLRTSTLERIQIENLELTRSNRELAIVRQAVGVAGPSEVYRWESQLASDQSTVIDAIAQRNAAEIGLNRLLARPLEEPFLPEESDLEDPLKLLEGSVWSRAVKNPFIFGMFRTFMSEVGLEASPALDAIDAGIAATERRIVAANRAWWLPQFSLEGQLNVIVSQDGNGSEDFDTSQLPPGFSAIPAPDDVSWLVGVGANYPLFTGLERLAEAKQSRLELEQQRLERQSVALQVEERIRQSLHVAGASYAAIGLSRESAEAARKNLDVIRDAYAEGSTSYLNLLDAQNQALVADQVAANAVYDFLRDLMDVQRAVSRFLFLEDPAQSAKFEEDLVDFFRGQNYELPPASSVTLPAEEGAPRSSDLE